MLIAKTESSLQTANLYQVPGRTQVRR